MHIKYHGEIFVSWTAKAQKAVLKVTDLQLNKQICRQEWDQINPAMPK